jgi:hypothetical protein
MRADAENSRQRRLVLLGCLLALALAAVAVGAQASQRGAVSASMSRKDPLSASIRARTPRAGLAKAVAIKHTRPSASIRLGFACNGGTPGSNVIALRFWRVVLKRYPQAWGATVAFWARRCHWNQRPTDTPVQPTEPTNPSQPTDPGGPTVAPPPPPPAACTTTLAVGANLSGAISNAAGGAVLCLQGGTYGVNLSQVRKSSYVTVQPASGQSASLGRSSLNDSSNIRFRGLKFTDGVEMIGATSHIDLIGNEFTGDSGIRANGEDASAGTAVTDVRIAGNNIHNLDYSGSQGTSGGYGITAVNGVRDFMITGNTIKSVAADYIQSASPVDFTVDHNTFLGPSLVGSHPSEHQDLWQIFGGGTNIAFTNNVARNTGTHESLLFQEGAFRNVRVVNNLFDHDSRGYTCQILQTNGLVFRNNTIIGSRWGCLFRDMPPPAGSSGPGSAYQVDHNIFVGTTDNADLSTEGRAGSWGTYDYNVSSDGSASGPHSVRNWNPSWASTVSYLPAGLSITAGYRAP